jgi:hypothetical protein
VEPTKDPLLGNGSEKVTDLIRLEENCEENSSEIMKKRT